MRWAIYFQYFQIYKFENIERTWCPIHTTDMLRLRGSCHYWPPSVAYRTETCFAPSSLVRPSTPRHLWGPQLAETLKPVAGHPSEYMTDSPLSCVCRSAACADQSRYILGCPFDLKGKARKCHCPRNLQALFCISPPSRQLRVSSCTAFQAHTVSK